VNVTSPLPPQTSVAWAFPEVTDLAPVPVRPRRIVFLGTPEAAVVPLLALVSAGFEVTHVISRADRRRGRRGALSASPVKASALDLGLPVSSEVGDVLDVGAELGVVVAFGQIIATPVLEHLPMVNLHFSLLPRWRGAAPVERAILAGDDTTGVCVMKLVPELDAGSIYRSLEVPVTSTVTAAGLTAELSKVGAALLVESLTEGLTGDSDQVGEVTYAHKITRDDLRLDFGRSAVELERVVRVGGAWTTFRGHRLKVLEARAAQAASLQATLPEDTGLQTQSAPAGGSGDIAGRVDEQLRVATASGVLELIVVQAANKAPMAASAWANGARLTDDDRLGQ